MNSVNTKSQVAIECSIILNFAYSKIIKRKIIKNEKDKRQKAEGRRQKAEVKGKSEK